MSACNTHRNDSQFCRWLKEGGDAAVVLQAHNIGYRGVQERLSPAPQAER